MTPPNGEHCDDYLDEKKGPACLLTWLEIERLPAIERLTRKTEQTKLFATWRGKRFRCIMASRLGDVGITSDFNREAGYEYRVLIMDLTDFSETP